MASCIRHSLYETEIEDHLHEWTLFKEKGLEIPMGWEDSEYFGSPQGALIVTDPVFQEEVYRLWEEWISYTYEYRLDILISLLDQVDNDGWNLLDAYESFTIFKYLGGVLTAASGLSLRMAPSSDHGEMLVESIVAWEAAGGKREGNWMEDYKQSPYYETFLTTLFDEFSDPQRMSTILDDVTTMEDLYQLTRKEHTFSFSSFLLQKNLAHTQKKMVEIAYERYCTHFAEKDIVKTDMDAWVMRFGAFHLIETLSDAYTFPQVLNVVIFSLNDLIIDLCAILGFSIVMTIIIYKLVVKKYFM
jgi:hypothetical protein